MTRRGGLDQLDEPVLTPVELFALALGHGEEVFSHLRRGLHESELDGAATLKPERLEQGRGLLEGVERNLRVG